jgi:flavin-dependent dehydrogenase
MIDKDVIIVGGGPAGSTCAWRLRQAGADVLVLDKQSFPRQKLCAGWIPPKVLRLLRINPQYYPHSLTRFDRLHFYIRGRHIAVPTRQYAIRRIEFDHWLLKRARVPVRQHNVKIIQKTVNDFILDETYRCRVLVGAAGTACPVHRFFFKEKTQRFSQFQITTHEQEFRYEWHDANCYLWFFDNALPGYSWYVPKKHGVLNIGIGAKVEGLRARHESIRLHWDLFIDKLSQLGLIHSINPKPTGWTYFLRQKPARYHWGNAFIIGDAAGLATLDMGEGIGPAVQSGLSAAETILTGKKLGHKTSMLSAPGILFPWI